MKSVLPVIFFSDSLPSEKVVDAINNVQNYSLICIRCDSYTTGETMDVLAAMLCTDPVLKSRQFVYKRKVKAASNM